MKNHIARTSVLLALICFALPQPGAGADDSTKVYRSILNVHMSTFRRKPNYELALKQLNDLAKRDPSNGMLYYVRAAVFVKKRDWPSATRELKVGNSASKYLEYQNTGPLDINMYPGFSQLRGMVNESAKVAPSLPFKEGVALLTEIRTMGSRICKTQPKESICPLAGVTMRAIAEKALVDLYRNQGHSAAATRMRSLQQADLAWGNTNRAIVTAQSPYDWDKHTRALAFKHGITQSEFKEWGQNRPLSPAAKQRFVDFKKDAEARERALTEKLLASMPK